VKGRPSQKTVKELNIFFTYSIDSFARTINNIPFGYKLNQFTINKYGSLASSLDFLHTSQWIQVYTVQRISHNNIIVDEIDILDGSIFFILLSHFSFQSFIIASFKEIIFNLLLYLLSHFYLFNILLSPALKR
jgi:hypothetical protein